MKPYKGDIAESWKPTFENVTREFVRENLYKILFGEDLPNFIFEFKEAEAIDFIEKLLKRYTEEYDFYKEKSQKILQSIKQKTDGNELTPVMVVNNYKQFFELLRQYYERDIELYFLRTRRSAFPRYEKDNCFEQIWLRATPEDFNHPEEFLQRQVDMINDTTFEKYDEETYLGKINFLDNHVLCVKNGIARTWDENSREIQITIYDKNHYDNKELYRRPHYTLPVIRYGIYQKNGRKICHIGSIQDMSDSYEQSDLSKKINRKRFKANEGVPQEETQQIEPKNVLALSIFINLLNKEGITDIEVPSLYVLDYDYHVKRNPKILSDFQRDWNEDTIKEYPEQYKRSCYYFERAYKKEDIISEIKTERLLLTFRRLLQHYPNGNIISYPGEADSFMHLNMPIVRDENDINGSVFRELYEANGDLDDEIEI